MNKASIIRRGILLRLIYPLCVLIGAIFPSRKEALQNFIIRQNNKLVRNSGIVTRRILVLLPHCLQIDKCDIRITHDIRKCKGCGRCEIKGLVGIADDFGLTIHVATGGNLARRIVMDARPEIILAIACERDLSSGIVDVFPLPVYGVANERPNGPCVNTTVNIEAVRQAIELFVKPIDKTVEPKPVG